MNKQNEMFWENLELRCILLGLLRNIWLVVLSALIGCMAVRVAADTVYSPEYASQITFAVTSKSGISSAYGNMTAANEVSVIFSEILESDLMAKRICQELGTSSLPGTLSAQTLGETNMLVVTARSSSPRMAFLMVQAVKEHYTEFSSHIDKNAVLQILSDAQVSTTPVNALDTSRATRLAAALCAAAMTLILVVLDISRDTVQTPSAARNKLDGPVLVSVPHERRKRKHPVSLLISSPAVSFFFGEAFFQLRSSVEAELERMEAAGKNGGRGRVILVTSVAAGEGKSTIAANLALALAKKHSSVMLIDADLRNPTQASLFGEGSVRGWGLTGLLRSGEPTLDRISEAATYSPEQNIALLLNKNRAEDAAELLDSAAMARLVELMRENMEYVVIDSPPISMFSDSDSIADLSDVSVLVVRQDRAAAQDINDAIDALNQSRSRFLGLVLNDMRRMFPERGKTGYGYGYGTARTNKKQED